MTFASHVMEARRIALRMGTWVLYAVRDAKDVKEVIGFLRYTTDGLQIQLARTSSEKRRSDIKTWIGSWRKATRWALTLDPDQASKIAEATLRQLVDEPYYQQCGHPHITTQESGPRPPSKPVMRAKKKSFSECTECNGLGYH